jgi:hypothetical protein
MANWGLFLCEHSVGKMIIPFFVEVIEAGAFQDCHSLKSLEFEFDTHLQQIEENAFAGTALTALSFPNSLRSFFGSAFHGLHLTSVSFFPFTTALEFCDDNDYRHLWSFINPLLWH